MQGKRFAVNLPEPRLNQVRDTLPFVNGGYLMDGAMMRKPMPGKPELGGMKEKMPPKMEGKVREDHKAAVAKMHPEHLHKLVQDAHAGKYGPQAQQSAQMAMQPPPPSPHGDGDADDTGMAPAGNSRSAMFSSGASPAAPVPSAQPASRASMFQGR